jgi:hypothetical protein
MDLEWDCTYRVVGNFTVQGYVNVNFTLYTTQALSFALHFIRGWICLLVIYSFMKKNLLFHFMEEYF